MRSQQEEKETIEEAKRQQLRNDNLNILNQNIDQYMSQSNVESRRSELFKILNDLKLQVRDEFQFVSEFINGNARFIPLQVAAKVMVCSAMMDITEGKNYHDLDGDAQDTLMENYLDIQDWIKAAHKTMNDLNEEWKEAKERELRRQQEEKERVEEAKRQLVRNENFAILNQNIDQYMYQSTPESRRNELTTIMNDLDLNMRSDSRLITNFINGNARFVPLQVAAKVMVCSAMLNITNGRHYHDLDGDAQDTLMENYLDIQDWVKAAHKTIKNLNGTWWNALYE
jgi:hypothetical protein